MKLYFVGAGPGDPELLTLKAHKLLTSADVVIWAGSLINPQIIDCVKPGAAVYDSAGMTLEEIVAVAVAGVREGKMVVRLHTGDPSLFGAIAEQMDAFDEAGIAYEVVPGVSSFQSAASVVPAELTAPGVSQTVILSRVAGRTPVPESQSLEKIAALGATLCLFLSVGKIREIAKTLAQFYSWSCPASVVFRASWPDQKIINSTLADIADLVEQEEIKKTAQILVGPALKRPVAQASLLYDKNFTHGYRQAQEDES